MARDPSSGSEEAGGQRRRRISCQMVLSPLRALRSNPVNISVHAAPEGCH